jgi:hypothetical protein
MLRNTDGMRVENNVLNYTYRYCSLYRGFSVTDYIKYYNYFFLLSLDYFIFTPIVILLS